MGGCSLDRRLPPRPVERTLTYEGSSLFNIIYYTVWFLVENEEINVQHQQQVLGLYSCTIAGCGSARSTFESQHMPALMG